MGIALLPSPQQQRRRRRGRELMTFDQFCDLIHEDQKADLIKGVMYMQSPPSVLHEMVFGFLFTLLNIYGRHKKLGVVLGSKSAAKLGDHDGPEPDIMFIAKERRHLLKHTYFDGAPDLVVEITSPSTAHIDRVKKKNQYAEFGVLEYWRIDPNRQTVEFLQNRKGEWEPMPLTAEGIFHSQVVSGFWLNVNWLWQEELPDPLEAVTQIIG